MLTLERTGLLGKECKFLEYVNYSIPKVLSHMLNDDSVRNDKVYRNHIINNIARIKFDCKIVIGDNLVVLVNSKYIKKA